ncbi:MAG: SDR family oxidoreductase [Chromatiales bacterium]|nr:SDR family oxidoreductase [Chromatiales bacterium]
MTLPVVLITGASRGIGAATARLFAAKGYAVGVNFNRGATEAEALVADLKNEGHQAIALQADVADENAVLEMFETLDRELGVLNVLVNNAGISGPRCRVEELPAADLRQILETNVVGPVLCSQQAIRRMSRNHGGMGGTIINVSSGSAYIGNPGRGVHYAISKGALNSFTIGASQELVAEGIRVNAVAPGMTVTEMTEGLPSETFTNLPMGRAAEPVEIANAIYWLATDEASYVAGANIRVGGGRP